MNATPDTGLPYAFRHSGRVEAFADRESAEARADELGADGVGVDWVAWRRDDEPDDLTTFADDPPSQADRDWHSRWSPMLSEPIIDDEPDRMAWMDCWADLCPWHLYPGPGLWDEGKPFPDQDWMWSGLQDRLAYTVSESGGDRP